MIETPRARRSLEKLMKLARADADALRVDLADIERARSAAEASLADLDEKATNEETVAGHTVADIAAYREGVRARRLNLRTTLITLEDAELNARTRLEAAFIEVKKLEHLIEINDRADKKAGRRGDLNAMDDIATMRARR